MEYSRIFFIGAGPGDPELITVKGLNIINAADIIVYAGSLVPARLFENARSAKILDSSSLTLEQTHEIMTTGWKQGLTVARVHTGDPSLYGTIREQTRLLEQEGIPFEIIPGVTSAFAAAAAAGISFTLPDMNQTLIICRASGRTKVPDQQSLKQLAASRSSMAIYLSAGLVHEIKKQLLQAGLEPDTRVVIGWKTGWPEERLIHTTLQELNISVQEHGISSQAVFLVLPDQEKPSRSSLYHPDFSHGYRKKKK
ncbi:MAG: precorrin-4 C(11)-methyltransferase [Desulfonatronovibrionaceae bacterium]